MTAVAFFLGARAQLFFFVTVEALFPGARAQLFFFVSVEALFLVSRAQKKSPIMLIEEPRYSLIFFTLLIGIPSHCEAILENILLEPVV